MSRPALSLFVFGVYLVLLGLTIVFVPGVVLALFGYPPSVEIWPRVLGMVTFFLGAYHITGARSESRVYMRTSVWLRFLVPVFIGCFVLFAGAKPSLLLVALVDVSMALWTLIALRSEDQPAAE